MSLNADGTPLSGTTETPLVQPKIESYAVKLPGFWNELPEVWFVQAESQFRTSRISTERTKFDYTIQALPPETVKNVYDTVLKCHGDAEQTPYTTLKNALLSRYTLTEAQRLEKILSGAEMGDMNPSQFYNSLKLIAGTSATVNETLLRSVWIRRLPTMVQAIIQDKKDLGLEAVLASADSVHEIYQRSDLNLSTLTATAGKSTGDRFSQLENRLIDVIDKKFSQMKVQGNRSRSRDGKRSQGRSSDAGLCYYHRKFGDKAKKCREPCSKSKN